MSVPSPLSSSPISSRPSAVRRLRRQRQDGAGLLVGQVEGAVFVDLVARIVDQRDQRRHVAAPASRASINCSRAVAGSGAVRISCDDFVDIGDGNGQADQHMGAVARLVEQEPGAARHHFLAECDERREHVAARSSVPACRH